MDALKLFVDAGDDLKMLLTVLDGDDDSSEVFLESSAILGAVAAEPGRRLGGWGDRIGELVSCKGLRFNGGNGDGLAPPGALPSGGKGA